MRLRALHVLETAQSVRHVEKMHNSGGTLTEIIKADNRITTPALLKPTRELLLLRLSTRYSIRFGVEMTVNSGKVGTGCLRDETVLIDDLNEDRPAPRARYLLPHCRSALRLGLVSTCRLRPDGLG